MIKELEILELINAGARIYKPTQGFVYNIDYRKHCNELGLFVIYDRKLNLIFVKDSYKNR